MYTTQQVLNIKNKSVSRHFSAYKECIHEKYLSVNCTRNVQRWLVCNESVSENQRRERDGLTFRQDVQRLSNSPLTTSLQITILWTRGEFDWSHAVTDWQRVNRCRPPTTKTAFCLQGRRTSTATRSSRINSPFTRPHWTE